MPKGWKPLEDHNGNAIDGAYISPGYNIRFEGNALERGSATYTLFSAIEQGEHPVCKKVPETGPITATWNNSKIFGNRNPGYYELNFSRVFNQIENHGAENLAVEKELAQYVQDALEKDREVYERGEGFKGKPGWVR